MDSTERNTVTEKGAPVDVFVRMSSKMFAQLNDHLEDIGERIAAHGSDLQYEK